MESFGKVIGINLGLLLLYSLAIRVVSQAKGSYDSQTSILIFSMIAIIIHVVASFVTAIVLYIAGKTKLANSVLLSTAITLIVGFGVCWGNASI